MRLKINNLTTYCVKIPLQKPMYLSERSLTHAENIIVKVEADGLVGWGESASAPRMTGDTLLGMNELITRFFKPYILNQSVEDYKVIYKNINDTFHGNSGAKFAVYSALIDLYCRYQDISMWQVLGFHKNTNYNTLRILANRESQQDVEEAENYYNLGIRSFKLKIGKKPISEEVELLTQIRNVIGNSNLAVDSNGGLTLEYLNEFIDKTNHLDISYIEQPFRSLQYKKINKDVCLDESIFSTNDIEKIYTERLGQGVNLKLIKFSDPFELVKAAIMSHKLNLKINLSGKIAETSIATNVLLNCAATIENLDWDVSLTNQYIIQDVASTSNICMLKPVTVDEYLIKQFTYNDV